VLATACDISLSIRYEALAQPSRMVGTAFSVRPQTQRYEMGRNATPRNDANCIAICTAEILLAAWLIACARRFVRWVLFCSPLGGAAACAPACMPLAAPCALRSVAAHFELAHALSFFDNSSAFLAQVLTLYSPNGAREAHTFFLFTSSERKML